MTKKRNKVSLITLGCARNLVDSEVLLRQLRASGFETEHDPLQVDGGSVIINTCGFINDAKEESVETILQFAAARKAGKIEKLVVMGCLPQRYRNELEAEIPEVDRFYGVKDLQAVVETLKGTYHPELLMERELTTPGHYAWVKISEGCDRSCAFCSIPAIRGKHISRPADEIIREVKLLAGKGVKEIMLIAQDLSWYGHDLNIPHALAGLLERLVEIQGIEWIRLHYAYPAAFPWEILPLMRQNPRICNYLDIPFQHISDSVLKMMRRGYDENDVRRFVTRFREEVPGIVLRTTLLTGHPGESEKDFEKLLDFVRDTRFERVGVFPYSHEEGTLAGEDYEDEIPEKEKKSRAERIISVQRDISYELNRKKIGTQLRVLIDRKEGASLIARTEFDSPEVDQEVLIVGNPDLKPGDFVQVSITGAGPYDLTAIPVQS
ncbi:MAG: 30S ribosomal protein S12 methylthiotransferase RimO [Chlorobi bacterium]|nr:30S ribosomal protein S12 methylthiotransferase RimO [Chlorobiota bacterium]